MAEIQALATTAGALPLTINCLMTRELATELLKANTRNRPKRTRYIAKLAEAMRRGEWKVNGDTIRISRGGVILDGQHRLHAIVLSGVSVPVIIVMGLDDEVFSTIDRGIGRTVGDVFSISGDKNANILAAITRQLHIYQQTGNPFHGNPDHHPTAQQQQALLDANPGIRDSASWSCGARWLGAHAPRSLIGFCHFVFMRSDAEAARTFFTDLETGAGLQADSPVLRLRNRLSEPSLKQPKKEKIGGAYRGSLFFKAFKLHRRGASCKSLRVTTEGDAPERGVFVL